MDERRACCIFLHGWCKICHLYIIYIYGMWQCADSVQPFSLRYGSLLLWVSKRCTITTPARWMMRWLLATQKLQGLIACCGIWVTISTRHGSEHHMLNAWKKPEISRAHTPKRESNALVSLIGIAMDVLARYKWEKYGETSFSMFQQSGMHACRQSLGWYAR